ncbi:MAG: hypothetical protein ACRELG_29455 [Gemmataceae bacterium]
MVGNKALPEATRQQMEELIALHTEMKEWYDRPKLPVRVYRAKTADCDSKLKRLFESLRLKLGVDEDPRVTKDELKALGLL